MKNKIITTKDGSNSLESAVFGEAYHSIHGAIQESEYVFIGHGLEYMAYRKDIINVFEMGFGTGLNAWLTYLFAKENNVAINYYSIEQYPVALETAKELNYTNTTEEIIDFEKLHTTNWEIANMISSNFILTKEKIDLHNFDSSLKFDLIFYDAFAPNAQSDLWTCEIFAKMYRMLNNKGILVTYCAKGYVRRNLEQAGFTVERLDGPPGKREMLRAQKLC